MGRDARQCNGHIVVRCSQVFFANGGDFSRALLGAMTDITFQKLFLMAHNFGSFLVFSPLCLAVRVVHITSSDFIILDRFVDYSVF